MKNICHHLCAFFLLSFLLLSSFDLFFSCIGIHDTDCQDREDHSDRYRPSFGRRKGGKGNCEKMSSVAPVIIPAAAKHTATILFLHGLGDTGHGWASSIAEIKPPHAKLICPTAEEAPVTINGGYEMPSWFDIRSLDKNDGNEDEPGVKKAAQLVTKMIEDEVKGGIPADRIVLGGFSQGGALSLYTGLTGSHLLGGLVILSGYLPIRNTINWSAIQKPPILQCHGDRDTVVKYAWGKNVSEVLEQNGLPNYTFKTYRGLDHSANDQEINDVANFLKERLPPI